jgi:ParB family chromosome partitioning protein
MAKKALGRGLGAFFPDYEAGEKGAKGTGVKKQTSDTPKKTSANVGSNNTGSTNPPKTTNSPKTKTAIPIEPADRVLSVLHVPLGSIRANPDQPRKEFPEESLADLAASITLHGLIQPITVRALGEQKYELVSGERRLRASKLAGLKEIPAYIREITDQQRMAMALVENIQREQLNPIDEALGYERLMQECGLTQEQVSTQVGKSRSAVANMLRLLSLPPIVQTALKEGKVSMGHARALILLKDEKVMASAIDKIAKEGWSVREVEAWAKTQEKKRQLQPTLKQSKLTPFAQEFEKQFSSVFGTRVKLRPKKQGGVVRIEYYNDEDLERMLEALRLESS